MPIISGGGGSQTYVQDADPGAVGARTPWLQTNVNNEPNSNQLWVRNPANSGWDQAGPNTVYFATIYEVDGPNGDNILSLYSLAAGGYVFLGGATNAGAIFLDAQGVHFGAQANAGIRAGTVDPSGGSGVAATLASLYLRQNGAAGELWVKTGAADTAWQQVTVP